MAGTAEKTDPKLWDRVKKEVTAGEKGGRKGQWSARKAQLASAEYKKKGGGYKGAKTADNHLSQWTKEEWGTESGRASRGTGERYLPRKAREKLSDGEYARTTAAKRHDTAKGKQFSRQPADVAEKAAKARRPGTAAKRRPAAKAGPARKAASARRTKTATASRSAPAKPPGRKAATGTKAPARGTAAPAREAGPPKTAARTSTARKPAARKPASTAPRKAAAAGAGRKPAIRKPAAKRTVSAARSTKGASKR